MVEQRICNAWVPSSNLGVGSVNSDILLSIFTLTDKMPWGLIHVRYCDKKLYIQFEEWYSNLLKQIIGGVAE